MANLQVVIQHHNTQLIKTFKPTLAEYSNTLWQYEMVTEAVKDITLDTSKGDEYSRASYLVSCVSKTISTLDDKQRQIDRMEKLLKILDGEAARELADSMRKEIQLISGTYIQPAFANPTIDNSASTDQHVVSEPYDMDFSKEVHSLNEPQIIVGLSHSVLPVHLGNQFVFPQSSLHNLKTVSDQAECSNYPVGRGTSSMFGGHGKLKRHQPSASTFKTGRRSSDVSEIDHGLKYTDSPSHLEELRHTRNMQKYEVEIAEMKKTLEEKEKECLNVIETLKTEHKKMINELNQQIYILQSALSEKGEIVQLINSVKVSMEGRLKQIEATIKEGLHQNEATIKDSILQLKKEMDVYQKVEHNNDRKTLQEQEKIIRERESALLERDTRFEMREKERNKFQILSIIYHVFIFIILLLLFFRSNS